MELSAAEHNLAVRLVEDVVAYVLGTIPGAVLETDLRMSGQPSVLLAGAPAAAAAGGDASSVLVAGGSFDVLLRVTVWGAEGPWAPYDGRLLALDAKVTTWPLPLPLDGASFRAPDG